MRIAALRVGKGRLTSVFRGLISWLILSIAPAVFAAEKVSLINIDGAIGPATASYISRSIDEARAQNARVLSFNLIRPVVCSIRRRRSCKAFLGLRCQL